MSEKPKLSKTQTDAIKAGILNHYDQGQKTAHAASESNEDAATQAEGEPATGYKNPPKDTRFKPGQSGNPKGRPKGSYTKGSGTKRRQHGGRHEQSDRPPDLLPSDVIFSAEGRRLIRLTENGTSSDLPIEQVAMRSTYTSAAKGDPRAQKLVFDRNAAIEAMVREQRTDLNARWAAYRDRAYQRLERIEAGESDLISPLPHPDDVILSDDHDPKIIGPIDEDEQAALETLLAKRAHLMREHAYVERFSPDNPVEDERLQAALESKGLDIRYYDTSGLTGAFLAITQLEEHLIPPRTRWSHAEMVTACHRALCTSRRELEKLLTAARKTHGISLKRGEFYPSPAFEIDFTQFAYEAASLQQEAFEKAKSKARAKGRDQDSVTMPMINPDIIIQLLKEHNLSQERLKETIGRDD